MKTATKQAYEWVRLTRIPRGHKFFRDGNTDRVACADDSGSLPQHTEDGVLWIVRDKPIVLQEQHESASMIASVPVTKQRTGESMSILSGPREVMWLVRELGMSLKIQSIDFGEQDEEPKIEDSLMFVPVGD